MSATRITASIVVFNSCLAELEKTLQSLDQAVSKCLANGLVAGASVALVDNHSEPGYYSHLESLIQKPPITSLRLELKCLNENSGYGRGHNAVPTSACDIRLVLNPDVFLEADSLIHPLRFFLNNPAVGILVPNVVDADGEPAYLCKRYPSVMDLALRGFAPAWLKRCFRERLDRYEMRDLDWQRPRCDIELASGCCFLVRGEVWNALGGFSPNYFMYFEDFDFFIRAARLTQVCYLPEFVVTHLGGCAARKGWRHVGWFMRSARMFFSEHGWRLW